MAIDFLGSTIITDVDGNKVDVVTAISALPGSEGWYTSRGHETFIKLANELVLSGLEPQGAYDVLAEAFGAVRSEYGD